MPNDRFIALIVFCSTFNSLSAQDQVTIQQSNGTRVHISGYVEDYTGRELIFKLKLKPNDSSRRYPREEVVEVTTEYTPHHERARELYAKTKIKEAKTELETAFRMEDRPWVRREILASHINCDLWTGDYINAISHFVSLLESDPTTFHFGLIPLCWCDDEPPEKLRVNAREWIAPTSEPVLRLIGASWLLSVPDRKIEAEQTLKQLARNPEIRIQRLAQMQLWRTQIEQNGIGGPDEIERWQQILEKLPVELRGGPYFVIGQAWKHRREFDRAARAFLWLPIVYETDRWLASRACFEAAQMLQENGDLQEATNLYNEVIFRYSDTPLARKAEIRWAAIRQTKSDQK